MIGEKTTTLLFKEHRLMLSMMTFSTIIVITIIIAFLFTTGSIQQALAQINTTIAKTGANMTNATTAGGTTTAGGSAGEDEAAGGGGEDTGGGGG